MADTGEAELHAHYQLGKERDRLAQGGGLIEYLRRPPPASHRPPPVRRPATLTRHPDTKIV
jgi:hypothetical protein